MPNNKPFIVANVRDIIESWEREDISFSRMVEMLNEIAEKFYQQIIDNLSEQINDAHHF